MASFVRLLRDNANYRNTWLGQVVSEIGDHFNNIAVFSLVMKMTDSGMALSGVLLARGVAVLAAGPLAGVVLDRLDRRQLMIASDLFRCVVAIGFSLCLLYPKLWLLYLLSFLLMFASPFFTSGRAAILTSIASKEELHSANALTQTTQWTTLAIGTMLGGASVMQFGYEWAFLFNALSFGFSAVCISKLRMAGGFVPKTEALTEQRVLRPWHDYTEGLRYMRSVPLVFGLTLLNVGWASGGGAAQVLFTLFGEKVFNRGGHRAGLGHRGGGAVGGRRHRAHGWQAALLSHVFVDDRRVLFLPRPDLRDLFADEGVLAGAVLHRGFPRLGGRVVGAEHGAVAAARGRWISRTCVLHHGVGQLGDHDAVDDRGRHRVGLPQSANDRAVVGHPQRDDLAVLGVGGVARPHAGTAAFGRGPG